MNQPSNFLNAPQTGAYHPPATRVQQTEEVRAGHGLQPAADALLSVSSDNRLVLSKGLLVHLNLGADSRIRIVPPRARGGRWHFDTQPRPGEGLALPKRGSVARWGLGPLPRWHFMRPAPVLAAGSGYKGLSTVANQNVLVPLLRFRLGREVGPGYYELERV